MFLARLFRRRPTRTAEYEAAIRRHPANACAICGRAAGMGHNNRAHDAHLSAWTGTAVPVDGKPALAPQKAACVVCATNGQGHGLRLSRREWDAHMDHTIADEADRYQREVRGMNAWIADAKGEPA